MDKGPRKHGNAGKTGSRGPSRKTGSAAQKSGKNPRSAAPKGGKPPLKSKGMYAGVSADGPKRSTGTRSHGASQMPRKPNRDKYKRSNRNGARGPRDRSRQSGSSWIWGWHAVQAVLANPRRTIHTILATDTAAMRLGLSEGRADLKIVPASYIDTALPRGAAHQGVAVKAAPLEWPALSDLADGAPEDALILVLDQITDPHNVGAMLRLCSAFGVSALIMQTRKAPPLAGATAKVAVGCTESVPVCLETNIAQTLKTLQTFGYHVVGLAGETETTLAEAVTGQHRIVLVMGAEGPGLRELVAGTCDQLAKIPMRSAAVPGQAESLNVATAAGIALYEARRG